MISNEIRERDNERFETEIAADDVYAGVGLQYSPFSSSTYSTIDSDLKQAGRILNGEETEKDVEMGKSILK